jgi:4,5-dihydroxyphthalate decarboxylase
MTVHLALAIGEYDHVRDLVEGQVRPAGIDLTWLNLPVEEIFFRFPLFREWDVSEMSLGKYAALRSRGDEGMIALPVFPSRVFRLSAIYVRADAGIETLGDLAGKRVGIPEWAQTATIYVRGYLAHEAGVPLQAVQWHQAGVNQAGRAEKVELRLPEGVRCTAVRDRSLSEMLLGGDLDAVISARPPRPFAEGHPGVRRLLPDFRRMEEEYWRKTGVFPIMHVVALRREILDAHPWVAMNLFEAFEEAKRRSLARLLDVTASRVPIPWTFDRAAEWQAAVGEDFWPYGVEPNRATLEAFLLYAHEQGVCARHLSPEELFAPQVLRRYRV